MICFGLRISSLLNNLVATIVVLYCEVSTALCCVHRGLCDHVMCGYIQAVTIIITLLSYMPEGQNYLVKMDLDGSLFLHENSIFIFVHVVVIPSPF